MLIRAAAGCHFNQQPATPNQRPATPFEHQQPQLKKKENGNPTTQILTHNYKPL